jgi:putative alpha-1,2-mannosidase
MCRHVESNPSKVLESAPRRAAGLRLFRRSLESQGIDLSVWEDLSSRLRPNHPLWTERSIDPVIGVVEVPHTSSSIRGFHTIEQRTWLVPSGPWPEDKAQRIIGSLARMLFTNTWRALAPLLLMMGMDEAQSEAMVEGILEEFADNQIRGYLKCHRWSARKI